MMEVAIPITPHNPNTKSYYHVPLRTGQSAGSTRIAEPSNAQKHKQYIRGLHVNDRQGINPSRSLQTLQGTVLCSIAKAGAPKWLKIFKLNSIENSEQIVLGHSKPHQSKHRMTGTNFIQVETMAPYWEACTFVPVSFNVICNSSKVGGCGTMKHCKL